jgi:hypothetical protein
MSGYTYERRVPTAAQREARKAFKEADAKVGMSEYERTQEAFHAAKGRTIGARGRSGAEAQVIRAGADFFLAQIAHAFTGLGLAAAAGLRTAATAFADLANRSLNVLRGRAQTAASEPHLSGLSQVDLAAYPRACTTRSGMRS